MLRWTVGWTGPPLPSESLCCPGCGQRTSHLIGIEQPAPRPASAQKFSCGEGARPFRGLRKGCSASSGRLFRLWIQPPTRWQLRGPFHDTRGKSLQKQNRRILKSTNCIHLPTPGTGRQGPLPEAGLLRTDARGRGTEMAFWPGQAAPKLEAPPQPGVLGPAPGLAGRTEWGWGVEGMGTEGPARRMGSGIYLRLALAPTQDSFRQNCDKSVMISTALGGAQSLGIHSMSF